MRSVNKVILIGNVTRDPEMKTTPTGQVVATFGLATNREWTTSARERKSLAEFHNIVVWGKLAEICTKLVKKGQMLYIEGYLKTRSWDNENGTKSFRTEIVADDMILLDRPKRDAGTKGETAEMSGEEDMPGMGSDENQSMPADALDDLL
jgi:single-strand DNA-binding protein